RSYPIAPSDKTPINTSRGQPDPHSPAGDRAPPQRARHRSRQLRSRLPASAPALLSRPREGTRNPAANTTTTIAPHTTATLVPSNTSWKIASDSESTPNNPTQPMPVARRTATGARPPRPPVPAQPSATAEPPPPATPSAPAALSGPEEPKRTTATLVSAIIRITPTAPAPEYQV